MKRKNLIFFLFIPVGVFAAGALIWRWMSSRQERPCPSWLSVLLENPYMNAVAGAEKILNRLEIKPGMSILDIGCGPGRLLIPAAQRAGPEGRVTALDLQPEMLRRAKIKSYENDCRNIQFLEGGIGDGLLQENSYDRALIVTVLGEVHHRDKAMAEIFLALKPGGILSVTEALPDPHYLMYSTVKRLALEAGFETGDQWRNGLAFTAHFRKPE